MINNMSRFWYKKSLGLLLLRLVTGLIFVRHGWIKFNTPAMANFFAAMGLPHWIFISISGLEIVGGLAIILGVVPRIFGALLGIEMLVAYILTAHSFPQLGWGFGAHEFEFLLAAAAFTIALAGSGKLSLYAGYCHHCGGMGAGDHQHDHN
jgi:putative oxidoreductase